MPDFFDVHAYDSSFSIFTLVQFACECKCSNVPLLLMSDHSVVTLDFSLVACISAFSLARDLRCIV